MRLGVSQVFDMIGSFSYSDRGHGCAKGGNREVVTCLTKRSYIAVSSLCYSPLSMFVFRGVTLIELELV